MDLAFASFTSHELQDSDDIQPPDDLKSQITEGAIHLICDKTHILGYIALWPAAEQMFIDTLAVLPMHRRQGLGSKLLAFADVKALRLGLTSITLFTKAKMKGNSEFYQSHGYGETDRCDDDGYCRVFYKKTFSLASAPVVSRHRT